jgi:NitT/TauT family transport system substrate-binding protein
MRSPSRSAFLSTVGAGIAGAAFPNVARAQATPVRAAGVFSDLFAEPFYAKACGAFSKIGLDLQPTNLYNAGAVAAAIGGGSLEMGMGDLISGVNAINAGVPIVLIAAGGLYRTPVDRPENILAVADTSPVREPKDLAGKVIGVPTLVGVTTACLRAWLPAHGVPESQVKLVEVPPPTVPAALMRGTIDAGLISEPFVTEFKTQLRPAGYPFDAAAELAKKKQICISVWYASKSWMEEDRTRARNVVNAIYETARWANAHQDQTFDLLVQFGKLDAAKIQGMRRVAFATSLDPDLIQPVLTIAENLKMYTKPVTAASLINQF